MIQTLGRQHVPGVTETLSLAFRDYPVMRYVLGTYGQEFEDGLRALIGFFVTARVLRAEPIIGALDHSAIVGAALVSYPESPPGPDALGALREEVWAKLGSDAQARYEALGAAWKTRTLHVPHIHLNMLGVHPDHRRRGLSRPLLDAVHRLASERPGTQGVTLTTEDPSNLPYYAHFGYEVIGHAVVGEDLQTWALFRSNGFY